MKIILEQMRFEPGLRDRQCSNLACIETVLIHAPLWTYTHTYTERGPITSERRSMLYTGEHVVVSSYEGRQRLSTRRLLYQTSATSGRSQARPRSGTHSLTHSVNLILPDTIISHRSELFWSRIVVGCDWGGSVCSG